MKKFLNIKELADRLNVSVKTLYDWVRNGSIPYRKFKRLVRFDEAEIEQWLETTKRGGRLNIAPDYKVKPNPESPTSIPALFDGDEPLRKNA